MDDGGQGDQRQVGLTSAGRTRSRTRTRTRVETGGKIHLVGERDNERVDERRETESRTKRTIMDNTEAAGHEWINK